MQAKLQAKPLVEALLAASVGLEQASDTDVDPDWAVKILENFAYHVGQIPSGEVPELLTVFEQIAIAADQAGNADWARFVRAQPFSLGLV